MSYPTKEQQAAYVRKWRAKHPDRKRINETNYRQSAKGRAARRRITEETRDQYIRCKLSTGTSIPQGAWPQWLVDLKRATIKLKRKYGIHQNRRGSIEQTD